MGTKEQISQLKLFSHELKAETLREFCEVCTAVLTEELEFIPNLQTPEDYGYFLVCENESTKIDEDMASFMDYKAYGESQLYGKQYISTSEGVVVYKVNCSEGAREGALGCDGDSGMMEQMMEISEQRQENNGWMI